MIDGVVFPHLSLNPEFPCQKCDVTVSNTAWSPVADDTVCDPTAQGDWANFASQACTFEHTCQAGMCTGTSYTCAPLQACEAALDEFPNVCDLTGPASATGGCQRRTLDAGVECAPAVHGCMPASYCTGSVGTCPPRIELPGIIYEDFTKSLLLRLPDSSPADPLYPVIPNLDEISVGFHSFRVQCGDLQLRLGIVEDGACEIERVSPNVGNGWGDGFQPAPRGSWLLLTRPRDLLFDSGLESLYVEPQYEFTPGVVRIDPEATDMSRAIGPDNGFSEVVEPRIDVEVKSQFGHVVSAIELVDTSGRSFPFIAPPVRSVGDWTVLSATSSVGSGASGTTGFDWEAVAGLRFVTNPNSTSANINNGTVVAQVRAVRLRSRAQGPPCQFRNVVADSVSALAAGEPDQASTSFVGTLAAPVDLSSFYDPTASSLLDGTYLSADVMPPLPSMVPTEFILHGAGGSLVVPVTASPAAAVDDATAETSRPAEWVHIQQRLRPAFANGTMSSAMLASITRVEVAFSSLYEPRQAMHLRAATAVTIAGVRFTRGAFCAHALQSWSNGAVDVRSSSSNLPAVELGRTSGRAALVLADGGGDADISLSVAKFDIVGLGDLFDTSCQCFPHATLEVETEATTPWQRLGRVDLVQASTGHGLQVVLPRAGQRGSSLTETLSVHLNGDGVTVIGPPSSWDSLDTLRVWGTVNGTGGGRVEGTIRVRRVRVTQAKLPCVGSPSSSGGMPSPHQGLVLTGSAETTLVRGPDVGDRLVAVSERSSRDAFGRRVPTAMGGAMWDGGAGDDTFLSADVGLTADAEAVVVGLVSVGSTSPALFADTTVHPTAAGSAVLLVRSVVSGRGKLALPLDAAFDARHVAVGELRGVGTVALVAGSMNQLGSPKGATHHAAPSSALSVTSVGGTDAVVAAVRVADGAVQGFSAAGSTAREEAWTSVVAGITGGMGVVLGGHSSGRATALGVPEDAFPAAARVCVVAAFEDATQLFDSGAADHVVVLGGTSAGASCRVTSMAAREGSGAYIVAGVYSGGSLHVAGSDDSIEAPAAGAEATFVLAVSAVTGQPLWLRRDAADASVAFVALEFDDVVSVSVSVSSAEASSRVSSLPMELGGASAWSVDVSAQAVAVARPGDDTVAVVFESDADVVVDSTLHLHNDGRRGTQGVLVRLAVATGAVEAAEAFGANGTSTSVVAAVRVPSSASNLLVAGSASGPVEAGRPVSVRFPPPASAAGSQHAFMATFHPTVVSTSSAAPAMLLRSSEVENKEAFAIASTQSSLIVAGSRSLVDWPTRSIGFIQSLRKAPAVAASALLIDSAWGVDGDSSVTSAVAVSPDVCVVVGHVNGLTAGYLIPPSGAAIVPMAYPSSAELFYAGVNSAGEVDWVWSGLGPGNTPGDDVSTDAAFDTESSLLIEVGYTTSDDKALCVDHAACETARVTLATLGGEDGSGSPVSSVATFLGGDGVAARATSVSVESSTIVVTGKFRRLSAPDGASAMDLNLDALADGLLRIPTLLGADERGQQEQVDVTFNCAAGGLESGFVAVYSLRSRALLWAAGLADANATEDVRAPQAAVATDSVLLATVTRAGAIRMTTAAPGSDDVATFDIAVGEEGAASLAADAACLFGTPLVDASSIVWSTVVTGSAGDSPVDLDVSTSAMQGSTWTVAGAGASPVQRVASSTGVVAQSAGGSLWSASVNTADGAVDTVLLFGATGTGTGGTETADRLHAVVLDAAQNVLVFAGASRGALLFAAVPGQAASMIPGSAATPASEGSWDVVVFSVATAAASAGSSAAASDFPPSTGIRAVAAISDTRSNMFLASPDASTAANASVAFTPGLSMGTRHTVCAGFAKGTVDFGDGVAVTTTGSLSDDAHAYDGIVVAYRTDTGAAVAAHAITNVGTAAEDDRLLAAAPSADGVAHFVVGHAEAVVATQELRFGGATANLPGNGGRDGFVARLSDDSLDCEWIALAGAVDGGDDVLVAVAADVATLAVVGHVSTVIPTFGGAAITDDSISSRTVATVYTMSPLDGSERWGKAYGCPGAGSYTAATAVAADPSGAGLYVAGVFKGGSLVMGDHTFSAVSSDAFKRYTAFVAYVSATDGAVIWARAAHATKSSAGMFSVVRSLVASPYAVVAAGEFLNNPSAAASDSAFGFGTSADDLSAAAAEPAGTSAGVGHAFVAVFSAETGDATRLHVPTCSNCRAGGVALDNMRLAVVYSFAGRVEFPSRPQAGGSDVVADAPAMAVHDAMSPRAHRSALAIYDSEGTLVSMETLGRGTGGHVVAHEATLNARGVLGLTGWRSGGVVFSSADVSASQPLGGRVVPPPASGTGSSLELQPFVAWFDLSARNMPSSAAPGVHAVSQVASLDVPADVDVAAALPHVRHAIGRDISFTTVSVSGVAQVRGAFNTSRAALDVADGAANALVTATVRHSGNVLWQLPLVPAGVSSPDAAVTDVASDPDGLSACVVGSVTHDGSNLPEVLGVPGLSVRDGLGGGKEAVVACFHAARDTNTTRDDNDNDDDAGAGVPAWVAVVGSPATDTATAVSVTAGSVWAAVQTRGDMHVAGSSLGGPTTAPASSPTLCGVAVFDRVTGAEVGGVLLGDKDGAATNECRIHAMQVQRDGQSVCVGGMFVGSTFAVASGVTLQAPSATHTSTGFVACLDAAGVGGVGPVTVRWASVAGSVAPDWDGASLFSSVSGLLWVQDAEDGRTTEVQRLYVAGMYHGGDISWGTQADNVTQVNQAAGLPGAGEPSAAFVACFQADYAPAQSFQAITSPEWVVSLPSLARSGVVSTGNLALQAGKLLLPAVATAGIQLSPATPAVSHPSPNALAAGSSFAAVLEVDPTTGAAVRATVVADAEGVSSSSDGGAVPMVGACSLAAAGYGDAVLQPSSSSLVLAVAARGGVWSSRQRHAELSSRASRQHPGAVQVATLSLGDSGVALGRSGVPVRAGGLRSLSSIEGTQLEFDIWTNGGAGAGAAAVTSGEWRVGPGAGPGLVFTVAEESVQAQLSKPRQWLTIHADVVRANDAAGHVLFGAMGGEAMSQLGGRLELFTTPVVARDRSVWRVRNMRLVARSATCSPIGSAPLQVQDLVLRVDPTTASPLSDGGVEMEVVDDVPAPFVDADVTTLVDPSCNCLAGAVLTWTQEFPDPVNMTTLGTDAAPVVSRVQLASSTGLSGVSSSTISYDMVDDGSGAQSSRVFTAQASLTVSGHWRAAEMDWRQVSSLRFFVHAVDAGAAVPDLLVSHVYLDRAPPPSTTLLHPYPDTINSTVQITRVGLNLARGKPYRVITYETNMWGDDSVPTCSDSFVADDTPPIVSDSVVIDVLPTFAPEHVDQALTRFSSLRVGWAGNFEEPDSAPDGLMLFKIVNVTVGAADGPQVDSTSEETVLAATSTGYVTTGELELEDGRKYFAHLGICNVRFVVFFMRHVCVCVCVCVCACVCVCLHQAFGRHASLVCCLVCVALHLFWSQRGKVCSSVPSNGVVHDASPPTSAAVVSPSTPAAVAAFNATAAAAAQPAPTSFAQTNTTAIHAAWAAFYDPHTWVGALRVGLGTAEFGTDVHEFVNITNTTTSWVFGPKEGESSLLEGQAYYVVFSASNAAGAQEFTRSAPVYIDTTPPDALFVVDIAPEEIPGQDSYYETDSNIGDVDVSNGKFVRAKFSCDDDQSVAGGTRGAMTYRWRVCSASDCAGSTNLTKWMETGTTPRGSVSGTGIVAPTLYVQMECTNPAGLSTLSSSDGITIHSDPPNNATAWVVDADPRLDPVGVPQDVAFLPTTALRADWGGFTVEDGKPAITTYTWQVGTTVGGDDVWGPENVALAQFAVVDTPDVTFLQNTTYYVTVTAFTASGSNSYIHSDGVLFDFIPPSPDARMVAPAGNVTGSDRCAAHLSCQDLGDSALSAIAISPSATALSVAIMDHNASITPLLTVQYGLSTCGDSLLDFNTLQLQTADSVTDSLFHASGLQLFHGQTYCGAVVETTIAGLVGMSETQSVLVDLTAPVPEYVHEGNSHLTDIDYTSASDLNFTYSCRDEETGIHHVEVRVTEVALESGAELGELLPWTTIPGSSSGEAKSVTDVHQLSNVSFVHGTWYVTSVRCVNGAGAYADADSDGILFDDSAPDTTSVRIQHALHDVSVRYQTSSDSIQASWFGFSEEESAIVRFSWSIGSTPHGVDILPVTPVGTSTTASATGLALEDGATYYVTVFAESVTGLTSSVASGGVTVDTTPPTSVELDIASDHPNTHPMWIASTHNIHLHWQPAVDAHSVNITYRWSIGTTEHGQQVVPLSEPTQETAVNASGLQLVPGAEYFATVVASNDAGLQSAASSSPFRVDPFPPAGTVVDGLSMDDAVTAQVSTDTLSCAWQFDDTLTYVDSVRVGFGTLPGTADVVSFVAGAGPAANISVAAPSTLEQGAVYFCTVRARDAAGNIGTASSRGVVVDATPPTVGAVLDVSPANIRAVGPSLASDVDFHANTRQLAAVWPGWHESETAIVAVAWAVGTTPGGTDVMDWTSVSTYAVTGVYTAPANAPLVEGETYYASVRMTNSLQQTSTHSSDGVTILSTPDAGPALSATAALIYTPAPRSSHNGTWCACREGSDAVFNPSDGTCTCGPGMFLDPDTLRCSSCPAGTCKPGLGNALALCNASMCGVPNVTVPAPVVMPLNASACGDAMSGRVQRPEDGACVCPPGTSEHPSGACVPCDAQSANPWYAPAAHCSLCWDALVPDVSLRVTWNASALAASPACRIVVGVGTGAGSRWRKVVAVEAGHVEFHSHEAPPRPSFRHGARLQVRVQAVLVSDPDVVVTFEAVATNTLDLSPPVMGSVSDGAGLSDVEVVSTNTEVSASWFGFEDLEQETGDGEVTYMVAFGSQGEGSTDIVAWTDVGADTNCTFPVSPNVQQGTVVTASVRAVSPGGWVQASSNGAVVQSDLTGGMVVVVDPATVGPVHATRATAITRQTNGTALAFTWYFPTQDARLDDEALSLGRLLQYWWAVVDADTEAPLTNVTAAGQQTWAVASELALQHGHDYKIRVWASNDAGVTATAESAAVTMDETVPTVARVGVSRADSDAATGVEYVYNDTFVVFQSSTTSIGVEWDCVDPESGVDTVLVAVGGVIGGDQGSSVTKHSASALAVEVPGLELIHSACYVAQVACSSGSVRSEYSSSSTLVCVDATPPMVAAVPLDTFTVASNASANETNPLVVTVEGGVVDDAATATFVQPFVLEAVDALRRISADGAEHVAAASQLDAALSIEARDDDSLMTHLEVVWSTSPTWATAVDNAVVEPRSVAPALVDSIGAVVTSVGVTYADLFAAAPDAPTLYPHVRGVNGAGLTTAVVAAPIRLDPTAPTLVALDFTMFVPVGGELAVEWEFADSESPVVGYAWRVQEVTPAVDGVTNTSDIVPLEWLGRASGVQRRLDVSHKHSYNIEVTACNAALLCTTTVNTFYVDGSGPRGGMAYGGSRDTTLEAACLANETSPECVVPPFVQLPAAGFASAGVVSWGGFWDDESGIASYTVALGTSAFGTQVGTGVVLSNSTFSANLGDVVTASEGVLDDILFHDATIYVSVTAENGAGLRRTVVAGVVSVNRVPPRAQPVWFAGDVATRPRGTVSADSDVSVSSNTSAPRETGRVVQSSLDSVSLAWVVFEDDASGEGVDFLVLELFPAASPGTIVTNATVDASVTSYTWDSVGVLSSGMTYSASVTAFDKAGNTITAHVSQLLVVDATAPVLSAATDASIVPIRDGLSVIVDSDCMRASGVAADTTTADAELFTVDIRTDDAASTYSLVAANWEPFSDTESGIRSIAVAVGTSPSAVDLLPMTDVPSRATAVQVLMPQLEEHTLVYFTVRATNGAGLSTTVSTDGQRVLCTPGTVGCAYDGLFLCVE